MKIKTIIVFYFALLSFNCFSQADFFRIKGSVTNDYDGYIYLSYGEKTDSSLVRNKSFFFEGSIDFPVESRLYIKNGFSTGNLYLENSKMEIEISIEVPITVINSIAGNKTAKIKSNLKVKNDPLLT